MPRLGEGCLYVVCRPRWLPRRFVVPIFLCVFLLVLYLLGKFLAAGVGRFFWNQFERLIHRLPLVSNVYSSIKQVTDFLFSEPEMQYTRVVAIEYPRRGIWTLGFVTGEGMHDIQSATDEPVVSRVCAPFADAVHGLCGHREEERDDRLEYLGRPGDSMGGELRRGDSAAARIARR